MGKLEARLIAPMDVFQDHEQRLALAQVLQPLDEERKEATLFGFWFSGGLGRLAMCCATSGVNLATSEDFDFVNPPNENR